MVAVVDMGKRAVNEQTSKRILTGEERIVMSVTEAAKIMGGRRTAAVEGMRRQRGVDIVPMLTDQTGIAGTVIEAKTNMEQAQ